MAISDALVDEPGKKALLMGNEAIARGFLEGGIQIAASYPGTPASEILNTLIAMGKKYDIYAEWSVNEKVAAEVAIAGSVSGLKSMVSMKGVGVNVASEPFQAYTYMRVEGGIVLVSADDLGCHSSHTEQDNRFFAREAYLPVFEPYDPKEARDMARDALRYSEEWGQPIMLRTTTRIGHTSSDVKLGEIDRTRRKGEFQRLPTRWVNLPKNARRMRKELIERMKKIRKTVNDVPYNRFEGSSEGKTGIIVSGISYSYVKEALNILNQNDKVRILKIGTTFPIPGKMVQEMIENVERVLIVEEGEPFVEAQVRCIASKEEFSTKILGKDIVPLAGELSTLKVLEILNEFMGTDVPLDVPSMDEKDKMIQELVPPRPPILCPGCGHRVGFYAINLVEKKLAKEKKGLTIIKPSDIGCYTLGYMPPLNAVDTNFCMGSSIGLSDGFSKAQDQPVICTIGDSTFFHAGIPPLLNAVFNHDNITVLLLDNSTTAMTGFQPHPGVGETAMGLESKKIIIEEVVKSCGVEFIKVVDAYDLKSLIEALEGGVRHKGPSVVIARRPCRLIHLREVRESGEEIPLAVINYDSCKNCTLCMTKFGCPAMYLDGEEVHIDTNICNGCGVCVSELVCKTNAIEIKDRGESNDQ
jgi:indolepyruvate ferredoxin oxidoreductase alpha subunit